MRFLRPNSPWNLCNPVKLMFGTLVLPLVGVFYSMCYLFSNNLHKDEWHTQQLACNVYLKVYLNVDLTLF